jgi:hypothetical protein
MKTIILTIIFLTGLLLSSFSWANTCKDPHRAEFTLDLEFLLTKKINWLQSPNRHIQREESHDVLFALRHFSKRWNRLLTTRHQTCQEWRQCQSKRGQCAASQMKYHIARVQLIQFFSYVEQVSINHKEFQLPVRP